MKNLHIHLSGIEYGPKGEKNLLPVDKSDFKLNQLFEALVANQSRVPLGRFQLRQRNHLSLNTKHGADLSYALSHSASQSAGSITVDSAGSRSSSAIGGRKPRSIASTKNPIADPSEPRGKTSTMP